MHPLLSIDWRRGLGDARAVLLGTRWQTGAERMLVLAGVVLIASGALHGILAAAAGWSFEGPTSARKPALFGLATGVTLASLGWVDGLLRGTRRAGPLPAVLAAAALVEVGIITLQFWRGVESHFNHAGGLDSALAWGIEGCAVLLTASIAIYVGWTCLVEVPSDRPWHGASPAMRLAVRFGLLSLLAGCLFGLFMVGYGQQALAAGASPRTFGEAGVLKFVHGTPLHAIQVMPLTVWILELGSFDRRAVYRSTALGMGSYVAFYGYTAAQTFSGQGRFDMTSTGGLLLAGCGLLGGWSVLALLLRPPDSRCPPYSTQTSRR